MRRENHGKPLVLVVDDEALIRWALSEGLADRGYAVCQASSGAETRTVLSSHKGEPFVVLLDLRLPDVADLSLLREIRATRPDVPVVVMTAHGTTDDQVEAERLGVFRFLSKPFDVPAVIRVVGDAWASMDGAGR